MRSSVKFALMSIAAFGASASVVAAAETKAPSSIDLLFERKHLENVTAGTDLVYHFERTVNQPDLLGLPFADDIKVEVRKVATDGTREVAVKVFTGERARDPQVIPDLTGNPILVVFLDRAIASYMSVAGGKVAYLKDKFRTALRERAKIEPAHVKLADKEVDAYRITIAPYVGDLNASKMRGFENSTFTVVMSDAVPGQFVEMKALYENTAKDAPRLEERTVMAGTEVMK